MVLQPDSALNGAVGFGLKGIFEGGGNDLFLRFWTANISHVPKPHKNTRTLVKAAQTKPVF